MLTNSLNTFFLTNRQFSLFSYVPRIMCLREESKGKERILEKREDDANEDSRERRRRKRVGE